MSTHSTEFSFASEVFNLTSETITTEPVAAAQSTERSAMSMLVCAELAENAAFLIWTHYDPTARPFKYSYTLRDVKTSRIVADGCDSTAKAVLDAARVMASALAA
jgi:hypothetical protein